MKNAKNNIGEYIKSTLRLLDKLGSDRKKKRTLKEAIKKLKSDGSKQDLANLLIRNFQVRVLIEVFGYDESFEFIENYNFENSAIRGTMINAYNEELEKIKKELENNIQREKLFL